LWPKWSDYLKIEFESTVARIVSTRFRGQKVGPKSLFYTRGMPAFVGLQLGYVYIEQYPSTVTGRAAIVDDRRNGGPFAA
jgi:hypothetical protein